MIVCATIVEEGNVLLVRHSSEQKADYGDWLLPAGRVESGETLEKALRREVMEELGLTIRIVGKIVEQIDPYTGDRLINFLCTPLTLKTKVSSELSETRWFNLNAIRNLENIHLGLKKFLIDGLEHGFQDYGLYQ